MANSVSQWSKDPKKKVGCVLVQGKRDISKGYNGFPENLSDDLLRLTNPEFKDRVIIHAEWNAVINAAKFGIPVEGSTAFVTYHPCCRCASVLIQAGVKRVVCPPPKLSSEKWRKDFQLSSDILYEAGVLVHYYPVDLTNESLKP
jgi:dCMP deaminase